MSTRTSATAQAILQALEGGAATAEQLRRRGVSRRQGLIDKALTDLATDGRVVAVRWDEDAEDKPHWQLTEATGETLPDADPSSDSQEQSDAPDHSGEELSSLTTEGTAEDPAIQGDQEAGDLDGEEDGSDPVADTTAGPTQNATDETGPGIRANESEIVEAAEGDDGGEPAPGSTEDDAPVTAAPAVDVIASVEEEHDQGSPSSGVESAMDSASTLAAEPQSPADPAAGAEPEPTSEPAPEQPTVKVCRGCQEQMPVVCPCCQQKTTSYCGQCRTKRAPRRRSSGESEILSNGLPKLRRGELVTMVEDIMRQHPIPEFNGIIGWTSSRIAVHLPGRSTGAIGEALTRLTVTGKASLLDESPRRYVLVTAPDAETVENDDDKTSSEDELS